MTNHVFVTGAAGFIGFHLAAALHRRGDHVVGFDNFNDYYDPQLKRERAAQLSQLGVEVIEGDITDFAHLLKAVKTHQTTHLVHLAAQAGVRYSIDNPQAYTASNLVGFANILEVCRQVEKIKLVYASSSSVYGLNEEIPFSEEDCTDHPVSYYGATKKCNEIMAQSYHHLYAIPMTGLRFFTVYGPWGRPDMAYFRFAEAIREKRPIQVFNHGKMERDFTYIDDIVSGIIAAMDRVGSHRVYNLGNHRPEPLGKLIETIEREMGAEAQKKYLPMQPGDVVRTFADTENSRKELGFEPSTPLEEGIRRFVSWYRTYAPVTAGKEGSVQETV